MNLSGLIANAGLLQTFLAGAGFLAPDPQSARFFAHLKYYIIAAVGLGVAGTLLLLTGLYLYLAEIMPPYAVCMIMGGVILAIGLIILAGRVYAFYVVKRKFTKSINQVYKEAKSTLLEVAEDVKQPLTDNPKIGIAIAVLIGFLLFSTIFSGSSNNKS